MQTTSSDLVSGWRYFWTWRRRFLRSTRAWVSRHPNDFIYLASSSQIIEMNRDTDYNNTIDLRIRDQKAVFLQAYLLTMQIESHSFGRDVVALLKAQSRVSAPHVYGFWFWQSDIRKFGGGVSNIFQGDEMCL